MIKKSVMEWNATNEILNFSGNLDRGQMYIQVIVLI